MYYQINYKKAYTNGEKKIKIIKKIWKHDLNNKIPKKETYCYTCKMYNHLNIKKTIIIGRVNLTVLSYLFIVFFQENETTFQHFSAFYENRTPSEISLQRNNILVKIPTCFFFLFDAFCFIYSYSVFQFVSIDLSQYLLVLSTRLFFPNTDESFNSY